MHFPPRETKWQLISFDYSSEFNRIDWIWISIWRTGDGFQEFHFPRKRLYLKHDVSCKTWRVLTLCSRIHLPIVEAFVFGRNERGTGERECLEWNVKNENGSSWGKNDITHTSNPIGALSIFRGQKKIKRFFFFNRPRKGTMECDPILPFPGTFRAQK